MQAADLSIICFNRLLLNRNELARPERERWL
jgi:hypothetical protein